MADKENIPVNVWYSQDLDPKIEGKKHVAFRLEEGEMAKHEEKKCNRSDDEHSTNVTPGGQTSEILMEKMRELREKLEKLKSKNRKSGGEGLIEGAASPSPPDEGKPNERIELQACASPTLYEYIACGSVLNTVHTRIHQCASPICAYSIGFCETQAQVEAPHAQGPGSLLSQPPQRVIIDEARAQMEEQAAIEAPPVDLFRAPASKRDSPKETNVEDAKPVAKDVVEVPTKEGTSEVSLDSVAKRREARRTREVKMKTATLPTGENGVETSKREQKQIDAYMPSIEIVNITTDTAVTRPSNTTIGSATAETLAPPTASMVDVSSDIRTSETKKSGFRSPPPKRRDKETVENYTASSDTQKQAEREASERTREQDRSKTDTGTEGGQEQIAQEKANILAAACQRGALEFLHSFAAGETSFLTVNGRRYMKLNQIGRGGSSKVYRVVSPNWSTYALKYVPLKNADTVTEESYLNEISLLNKLKHHDNIIRLIDSEVRSGGIFLLLEFAELDLDKMLKGQQHRNKTLDEAAKESGQLRPSNLLPSLICLNSVRLFWQQMLEAVHTIHEERVVHGDLKPANFVCTQGRLKLIDFGIAKAISNDTTNIVRDNQIGTLNYISPEALIDVSGQNTKFKLGRASDIWSLGCILYQMVYGRSPFASLDNMLRKLQAITNPNHKIDYPPIDNPPLLDTMKLCLRFDPRERPTIPELLSHPFLQ